MKAKLAALSIMVLAACRQETAGNREAPIFPVNIEATANETAASANEVTATAHPANPRTLEEPVGPIDPNSVEAAGQVVQRYGALIEQGRIANAASAWGDKNLAAAFAKELEARGLRHLEIGDLSQPEGAAGSIFVTMPVVFYRDARRMPATITLRRVNDVDGSTEAQRRWHIERIEWSKL